MNVVNFVCNIKLQTQGSSTLKKLLTSKRMPKRTTNDNGGVSHRKPNGKNSTKQSQVESTVGTVSTTKRIRKIGPPLLGKPLEEISNCSSCKFCQSNKPLLAIKPLMVYTYLFVSDFPSEVDDAVGEAFTDQGGRLLREIVSSFLPPEKWYAVNSLICTPYDENGDLKSPDLIETLRCSNNLYTLIDTINPKCIIGLGDIAQRLLKKLSIKHESLSHPNSIIRSGGMQTIVGVRFKLQLQEIIRKYGD